MKEDEHRRIWMPEGESSILSPCQYCRHPTSSHFFKFAEIDHYLGPGLGIMRHWYFCDEKCADKFKKEIADL